MTAESITPTNILRFARRYWGEPPVLQQWWQKGPEADERGEWRDAPTEDESP